MAVERYFVIYLEGDDEHAARTWKEVTEAEADEANGNEPACVVVEACCFDFETTLWCWQYYFPQGECKLTVSRPVEEAMELYLALMIRDTELGEPGTMNQ